MYRKWRVSVKHAIALFVSWFLISLTSLGQPVSAQENTDIKELVQGDTQFAIDLYKKMKLNEGNLFFSSYSIPSALAMTYGGARAETEKQMAAVLHLSLEGEKLHSAFADMQSKLNAVQRKKEIQVNIANSLWPQERYPFLKEYLKLAKKYYQTEITPVDYKTNPESARKKINSWVEEKTNNKIKNIISTLPDPLTRLILVNAVYFKGNWARQFEKSTTTQSPFYPKESKSIEVPMMNQTSKFNYGEEESLLVLELPSVGNELSMLVMLPKKTGGLQNLEEILAKDSLDGWTRNLSNRMFEVYLPRFKMTSEFSLDEELKSMGMNDAFDMDKADFSGMDGNPNWLYIGAVLHKDFVDVNKEGSEAAAATVVHKKEPSAPPEPVLFRADHPFLFLIRNNATRSILFLGRLINPLMMD
jgi:serpin B